MRIASCYKASSSSPTQLSLPKPNGFINDYANVFNEAEKKRLNALVAELGRDVDAEFGVVTIDTTNGVPVFDYSLALANEWRRGGKSGRGLLLVLAIKDRQWRLQVSKALEPELPDAVCKELGDPSIELYKKGEWADGVERYVRAIVARLKGHR